MIGSHAVEVGTVITLPNAETGESLTGGAPRLSEAIAPLDMAVLAADVRIYARALAERFEEAHVGA